MLRAYGPTCDGSLIEPGSNQHIPDAAAWIDLEEPTREEERLVETCIGVDVPTRDELAEIEPASRLYQKGGALYMTMSTLVGVEDGQPSSTPIGFVLAGKRLVTIRYATPKPVRVFMQHAHREPELAGDAFTAMYGLLDAIVDRLADELEAVGAEIERISTHIFHKGRDTPRVPAQRLRALLTRIGRTQSLLARIRETALSTGRLLSFLSGSAQFKAARDSESHDRVGSLVSDTSSLIDHSGFLADNLTFLMDASLGLISVEQNAAMKLFSWAALIFLPPTLIAGIYGMNFEHMPELDWLYGYPMALVLIVASAVLPIWFLKYRGFI